MATQLNWPRAAVLFANDGIVSTAGLVVGVADATAAGTPGRDLSVRAGTSALRELILADYFARPVPRGI